MSLTFGDLGQIFDGPHATPERRSSGPYFLNIASLQNGRLNLAESDHVSEADFVVWTRRMQPMKDDLLFSYETRLGEAALMPAGVRACLGRRMALLRLNQARVHPRFLLYYYLSPAFQSLIEQNTIHGATVNRISLSTMGSWPVKLPDLPNQQAIAEVLGALDDKIAANSRILRTSRNLASTLVTESVVTGGSQVALAEITSVLARGIAPAYVPDGGLLVLNQKCIRDGTVDIALGRMTDRVQTRRDKLLQPNDVLVNSTGVGTLGRLARWTDSAEATVDSHITIVRFRSELVEPTVAGRALLRMQRTIEELGEGSTGQTELARSMLAGLRLHLPSRERQAALAPMLQRIDALERSYVLENTTLNHLRDTLLPSLISGKLRVRAAEKQVEAVV
jgi:type I restriction enzyme S subunit